MDTAAALERGYSVEQLIGLALALDPGLTAEDFANAARRLDHLDDEAFARYILSPQDVARIREQFAAPHGRGGLVRLEQGHAMPGQPASPLG